MLVAPVGEEVAELTDVVPAAVGVELAVAAAVAVVAGAATVDVVSVVEALATSEAGDTKATVDVDVAEADGEVTLAAGFGWGAVVVVLTKLLELSPATDVPGLPAVTVGVATSSACALWAAKSAVPSKTEATPNEYLRNEKRWRLLKKSFIKNLPLKDS